MVCFSSGVASKGLSLTTIPRNRRFLDKIIGSFRNFSLIKGNLDWNSKNSQRNGLTTKKLCRAKGMFSTKCELRPFILFSLMAIITELGSQSHQHIIQPQEPTAYPQGLPRAHQVASWAPQDLVSQHYQVLALPLLRRVALVCTCSPVLLHILAPCHLYLYILPSACQFFAHRPGVRSLPSPSHWLENQPKITYPEHADHVPIR